jgi:hypothetical protein
MHAHSFLFAGANHYIAFFNDTAVLKFPVTLRQENIIYSVEAQRFRNSLRAVAVKGVKVEEQILRVLSKHPRIIQLKAKHEDGLLLEYLPYRGNRTQSRNTSTITNAATYRDSSYHTGFAHPLKFLHLHTCCFY